ncbi:LacI family DNA-binding transcriptional regulator [Staphylococcus lugdunensis]|uniref:LacI family DNA-binding transcriptional regulator n=1 Tax=Staphylococcus lugdunensis TaxID=28035 RepID=UPI001F4D0E27|nr:LacI family DNA-binding transcriptional regulator [Staphylococcus lugdunensis]MCH8648082.1 LacI family DNA-binding transcriptional regulator [Staphylococcus lugdunensis]
MKNIADIARLAGVSKSTVSRYLNNGSVSTKTKEKLSKIIKEQDYQPNQFAQSLRARHTKMIGAIIPRMNSYAVDETIKGVAHVCKELEYQLLLNYTGLDLSEEIIALETLSRSKVDGIILMATRITPQHLDVINKINVPVILVGQEHSGVNSIIHDDYLAGSYVGRQIVEANYKQVYFFGVTEEDKAVGQQRKNGVLDILALNHIDVQVFKTSFQFMEAKNDVKLHLQSVHTADAIIGATDTIALAIHSYCSQPHHKLIPHKIYGFGGDPITQIVTPQINTVMYHYFKAGQQALSQLHRLINHHDAQPLTVIPVEL